MTWPSYILFYTSQTQYLKLYLVLFFVFFLFCSSYGSTNWYWFQIKLVKSPSRIALHKLLLPTALFASPSLVTSLSISSFQVFQVYFIIVLFYYRFQPRLYFIRMSHFTQIIQHQLEGNIFNTGSFLTIF